MNIYAVRDRLIDYYQTPFTGPGDNEVKAALARMINHGETTSDIAQAPQHFELWHLGKVTDEGQLIAERYLVCDADSLVRTGVRRSTDGAAAEAPTAVGQGTAGA